MRMEPLILSCLFVLIASSLDSWCAQGREEALQDKVILHTDGAPRKAIIAPDGYLVVPSAQDPIVHRYRREGGGFEGIDLSAVPTERISPNDRRMLFDICLGPGGDLWALVASVNFARHHWAVHLFQFPSLDAPPAVVPIDPPIAARKVDRDARGNIYFLGLDADAHRATEQGQSGNHALVHKFSPRLEFLGSYLPVPIDPSTSDRLSRDYESPVSDSANFAVEQDGTAWVLWLAFPPLPAGAPALPSRLYRVDPSGQWSVVAARCPLGDGYLLRGVVKDGRTGQVALDWYSTSGSGEGVLADPYGERVLARGNFTGRVVAFSGDEVLTSVFGLVTGQRSLLRRDLVIPDR